MKLSDASTTAIIVCCTLGILGTILLLLCIRYDLLTKIEQYCFTPKVRSIAIRPAPLECVVIQ